MKLERITEIYDKLPTYIITLDPDPCSRGPVYLADLIAQCRNYLNNVGLLQHEVHREKHEVGRVLRAHEAAFQVSFDELLSNDERVRRLPSIEDRKATVNLFLREDRQRIEDLKQTCSDLDLVDKAIRHRHKELTSTMSEIKLQRSLIQAEIHTGAMYGDERVRGLSVADVADAIDETELDAALEAAALSLSGGLPASEKTPEPELTPELDLSGVLEVKIAEDVAVTEETHVNISGSFGQIPCDEATPTSPEDDFEAFLSDLSESEEDHSFPLEDV